MLENVIVLMTMIIGTNLSEPNIGFINGHHSDNSKRCPFDNSTCKWQGRGKT